MTYQDELDEKTLDVIKVLTGEKRRRNVHPTYVENNAILIEVGKSIARLVEKGLVTSTRTINNFGIEEK